MKTCFILLCLLLFFSTCGKKEFQNETKTLQMIQNEESLEMISKAVDGLKDNTKLNPNGNIDFGKKVRLYPELVDLFDPKKFICGCDEKLIKAMRKIKSKPNDTSGFVPQVVLNSVDVAEDVWCIDDNAGCAILAHLFQYKQKNGKVSDPKSALQPLTKEFFNPFDYVENGNQTFSNFFYTLDCSGYMSLAASVAVGIKKASLQTSAKAATTTSGSLIVVGGVMYSPLYLAFKEMAPFDKNDSITLAKRLTLMENILKNMTIGNL